MKNFLKLFLATVAIVFVYTSCQKLDPLPHYDNATAVQLSSSSATLTPTVADSNNVVVTFTWTMANHATDTSNYKYVLEIDSAGRQFSHAKTKVVLAANSTSLTGRELNAMLLDYGFTVGSPYNLEARVASSYGNNNEKIYSNTINLSVTPFNDPSVLTSTVSNVVLTLAGAGDPAGTFNWSPSFVGYTGGITYTIEYDLAGTGFTGVINTIAIAADSLAKTLTENEMNQTAINSGIVMGSLGSVEYRVKAVTALGGISYSNVVTIQIQTYVSILRFYMPGSYQAATGNGNDWDPLTAPELIRDVRSGLLNKMYYIYIYLPANSDFKVTQGQSWTTNYGDGGGSEILLAGSPTNFHVTNAGYYRICINVDPTVLKYNIMEGRMGFVGGATPAGWDPPSVFPLTAMAPAATNLFIGTTDFISGGWKFIDNNSWNSSDNVEQSKSYGTASPSGGTMEINAANFPDVTVPLPTPQTVPYRGIWDGRDRDNIKYEFMDASIMKLVGDGMDVPGVNDWDPPTSPLMTYSGNGVWTITIALKANKDIKFLAGDNWGAFDYEDNSGQSQSVGTPRGIKWEGGDNFKTPATAGTYTITLNENTQTVTVN